MTLKTINRQTKVNLIENICQYIKESANPPSLAELGERFKLSHYHLQRIFKNTLGISPKQYAEQYRQERLKKQLKSNHSVTQALYESGYSASSTFYSNITNKMGMTPKTYKLGGENLVIYFSITNCPLGKLLVASTEKGICMLSLADADKLLIDALKDEFPKANILRNEKYLFEQINVILKYLKGQEPHCDLPLDVRGTAFQKRVWDELKKISYGTTSSYEQIARQIGKPKAIRAVANACANNPVSLIVPCHRVVRKDGQLGGYRWELKRKQALIKMEKSNI